MQTERSEMVPDSELSEALDSPGEKEVAGLDLRAQRSARIDEYEEEAVRRSNPYAAMIGTGTAYLQRILEPYCQAIIEQLNSGSGSIDDVRELTPDIKIVLKLHNAVEADHEFQADEAGDQARAFPHGAARKGLVARQNALGTNPWRT